MKFLQPIRFIVFLIALGIIAISAATNIFAQRVIAVMNPYAQGRELKFDINADTTDNVAPNILFHPDGKLAYVCFAGSGTIVAFDPYTGQINTALKTEGYPSQIVFTPDRSSLLAVDVFSNRIIAVDLATFKSVTKWSFPNAQFGFGNNIVFSADGKTGFIANWRFDPKFLLPIEGELIRFNTADGKETGERLLLQKGPVQTAISPDMKTLAIVNTISETISLVDTADFKVRATATPEKGVDFTHLNKVAFSADSKVGIIANRAAAAQVLASDIAFIFQLSDGVIVKSLDAGSSPLGAYTSPDGKYFLILNNFGFKAIDTGTYDTVQDITTPYTEFTGNTNLIFGADSLFGYLVSPDQDAFMSVRLTTGGVERNYLLTQSGEDNKQSMQVALSPDGKLALVLSFKANTVTSIIDTYNTSAPIDVNNATFSGFSLINTSAEPVLLRLEATDINAQPFVNLDVNYNLYQDALVALSSSTKLAQSFKITSENESAKLVRLYLKRTGSFNPSAKLRLVIETDSSNSPSGTQVENALGEIEAHGAGESLSYIDFRFSQAAPLQIDTLYWLVLSGEGTYSSEYTAGSRLIEWGVDGSDPIFSNGDFSVYSTSWTLDAKKDALFNVVLSEVNPTKEFTLQPMQQLSATQDLFSLDDHDRRGRILVTAEKPGIKGYWVIGTRDMNRLDGGNLLEQTANDFILPEVMQIEDLMTGYSEGQDADMMLTGGGRLAQSFQVGSTSQVKRVRLYTKKVGTFTADAQLQLTIQLADDAGKPSGQVLENATATLSADSLFTIYALNEFQFENAVSLEAGITYCMVLEGTGTYSSEYSSSSLHVLWGVDGSSPTYELGQFAEYTGSSWTTDSQKDALFKILLGDRFGLATRINLINKNYNFTSGIVDLYEPDGSTSQEQSTSWPGLIRMAGGFEMFLPPGISDRTDGYLRVRGQGYFALFEDFGTDNSTAVLPAIPIDEAAYQTKQLYFPHFNEGPNINTKLNIINLSRETGYVGEQDALVALTGTNKLAQSFQLDQSVAFSLIRVLMKKTGTFTDTATIKASIQTDSSGSPSGTTLPDAVVEIKAASIGTEQSLVNIRFAKPVNALGKTTYWLVLEAAGTYSNEYTASTKLVELCVDGSSPTYTSGQFSTYSSNAWTADSAKDAIFQISLAEDNEITISLFSSAGKLITPSVNKLLPSGGQWKDTLSNLFPDMDFSEIQTGWIQVESSKPGIVGDAVFGNVTMDFLTAGLLQSAPMQDILFGQVTQSGGWNTGWALLNAGEVTADVLLEVYDPQGVLQGTKKFAIAPKNNLTVYYTELFPNAPELLGGYVRLQSSQPLFSFSIFNDSEMIFLSMIPAQTWQ